MSEVYPTWHKQKMQIKTYNKITKVYMADTILDLKAKKLNQTNFNAFTNNNQHFLFLYKLNSMANQDCNTSIKHEHKELILPNVLRKPASFLSDNTLKPGKFYNLCLIYK